MKRVLRRGAAAVLAVCLLMGSALALMPEQLGTVLQEQYLGDIPQEVWEQTTVEGMLEALGDPYARYCTAEEFAAFQQAAAGGADGGMRLWSEAGVGRAELRAFGDYGALARWVEETDPQVGRWIFDLRDNRGGGLQAAADALSVFTGSRPTAYLTDRAGKLFYVESAHEALTMDPVIVLVDEDTASAAELFAASVRDCQVGLVIGCRTYGKGVAQSALTKEEYPEAFADGSALLLTTDRVYSEAQTSYHIMGVLPHLNVRADLAEEVAQLLCAANPQGVTDGYLRVHVGRWRWYVRLADAAAHPAAFRELLEALPPQAALYLGTGDGGWAERDAAQIGAWYATGYTPRIFPDVDAASPWADAIHALRAAGVLYGDQAGRFNPDATLDRATLCALLAQAMGYPKSTAAPVFTDTPAGSWYTPYVTTLASLGIVGGVGEGRFNPKGTVSHQELMTILARTAARTNHLSEAALRAGATQEALDTGDYDAYSSWARTAAWMLDGMWHAPAKDIDPKAPATRAEAAYDLWAMLVALRVLSA